jgi:hypothetical protein
VKNRFRAGTGPHTGGSRPGNNTRGCPAGDGAGRVPGNATGPSGRPGGRIRSSSRVRASGSDNPASSSRTNDRYMVGIWSSQASTTTGTSHPGWDWPRAKAARSSGPVHVRPKYAALHTATTRPARSIACSIAATKSVPADHSHTSSSTV